MKKYFKTLLGFFLLATCLALSTLMCNAQEKVYEAYTVGNEADNEFTFKDSSSFNKYLVRTDKDGNVLWAKPLKKKKNYILPSTEDGVIIAGFTEMINSKITGNPWEYDYWIVIYSSSNSINHLLYPNPSKGYFTLYINEEIEEGKYWIILHDFLGKELRKIPVKSRFTRLDTQDLKKGVYHYSLNSAELNVIGKMVIQ